jgi:predicted acetyltransferase
VASTFLVAEVDGRIVGRSSIRHELNEFLLHEGGHVGYAVLPPFRGNGYAGEILRQSLELARALGIDDVLVCCDDDNAVSTRVIERAGGELESVVTGRDGVPVRRYWIRSAPPRVS